MKTFLHYLHHECKSNMIQYNIILQNIIIQYNLAIPIFKCLSLEVIIVLKCIIENKFVFTMTLNG